jgi:hypothetical protein
MRVADNRSKPKINIKDFPEFFLGKKNCFDCKNFKMKIPVVRVFGRLKMIFCNQHKPEQNPVARCSKNLLLKEDNIKKNGNIMEAEYVFTYNRWKSLKRGELDKDWTFANVCTSYESMLD